MPLDLKVFVADITHLHLLYFFSIICTFSLSIIIVFFSIIFFFLNLNQLLSMPLIQKYLLLILHLHLLYYF